ncbi:MAG: hypothetical protein E7640_03625 [Ruminococcaceae bacterium]|nr:hypothetical protein [Oscillospiraceae bacterium]
MYTAYSLLLDFCFMSGALFIAKLLRSKIKWLQNHYIPASVIAGFIGLLLGPQVAKLIPWSSEASSYPYLLICVLFATLFIGRKEKVKVKKVFKNVGDTFFMNMGAEIFTFGMALLVGGGILMIFFPNIFPEMSLLLPAGFTGGHGYAAAIGGSLNQLLGREDAVSIGQVFATVGLLVGLIVGIVCINIAAKRGATRFVKKVSSLPEEYRTGLINEENAPSLGKATMHPTSMASLTWNLTLILCATGLGYGAERLLNMWFPELGFPLMCLTMIAGMLIQLVLKLIKYDKYVDKKVIDGIGSSVTDYLVAFGVATIKLSVIAEFWLPIVILCVLGLTMSLLVVFVFGNKLFHNFWFERSIFIFGWITGVVAVGITLLRCVDPDMKSKTLDDYGIAYSIISIVEVFFVSFIPLIAVTIGAVWAGAIFTVVGLLLFGACALIYGIQKKKWAELREGEEAINQ